MKLLLLLLGWVLATPAPPARQVKESTISFQIANAGFTVNGTLTGLEATVQFDPAHLGQAHMQATVPVRSIHTGIALRDQHLQKPDYFDAAQFPLLMLASKSFRQTGPGQYEGVFVLTMKGVAREVTMPFSTPAPGEFRGTLQVNRLDYGIGKKSLVLAEEVRVALVVRL